MSRVAISVSCTDQERLELERLINSRTDEIREVERARIIMGCLAGKRNDEIAAELDIRPGMVAVWRRQLAAEGMRGVRDRQRPGKPPRYPASELRNRLLQQIEQPPPAGLATWDGGSFIGESAGSFR